MTQRMPQRMPERIPGGAMDLGHLAAKAASGAGGASAARGPGAPGGPAGPAGTAGSGPVVDVPSLVFDIEDHSFEQAAQLSAVVPVVIDLWAEWCQPCTTLGPVLERVTRDLEGRVVLGKVDVDANPGLAQAFQAQSIPMVVALVAGRPVPLFQGAVPEAQVREVFAQLLELAQQQGVLGRANAPESGAASDEELEPEAVLSPEQREAEEAIDRGDYAAAVAAYERALLKAPADAELRSALVQVQLLERLDGIDAEEVRRAAAADAQDVDAQLRVADLDVSGGHVEDAFLRLLELFAGQSDEVARTRIRERLLHLFEVVGAADSRVIAARGRLANLLY